MRCLSMSDYADVIEAAVDSYNSILLDEALKVVDRYLSDCDSIMEKERKNDMIDAMSVLLPNSQFAQRCHE